MILLLESQHAYNKHHTAWKACLRYSLSSLRTIQTHFFMGYSIFTCHKKKVFLLLELCLVSFHLFINVAYALLKQLKKFVIQFF